MSRTLLSVKFNAISRTCYIAYRVILISAHSIVIIIRPYSWDHDRPSRCEKLIMKTCAKMMTLTPAKILSVAKQYFYKQHCNINTIRVRHPTAGPLRDRCVTTLTAARETRPLAVQFIPRNRSLQMN